MPFRQNGQPVFLMSSPVSRLIIWSGFQALFAVKTSVPFQVNYIVKEPSGNLLSGLMMSPAHVDPKRHSCRRTCGIGASFLCLRLL